MSGGYVLAPRARDDLDGIWDDTAERWDPDQADRYVRRLAQSFADLATGTVRGRSAEKVRPGYFRLTVTSHVAFYRIGDGGRIEVIRILHARMDAGRHL
ncbi:type II toxin-antitoxin system RelE/ParE family toxin [Methylobacterium dankookense]|uniref:Toxin n=1 Tax=Methylobacterium dankookense TaxID=560405 RepID=A0A564FU82_9HYPH|nr:type II toxin-antitoxin system RelE/ParE family toxin [Methylobacterium dankookense]GJD57005.1 Toxin ParE1 [Methylobacterium dankookense]VUF10991.1 Toxin ParE1 [Methylobacterium dankookense]